MFQDPASSGVDRSNKAAAPPAPEKGEALDGMNASGGGNTSSGKCFNENRQAVHSEWLLTLFFTGSGLETKIEPKN